ncbi:MAG: LamG domain-containing protein, partial [Phycisphaerales bacterium]
LAPLDGEWHHLAATYDGVTIKGYGDGHLGTSEARALNTNDNVQMGKRDDNDNRFPGLIDEVRIYSRVLSQEEIASLAGKTVTYTQDLYRLLTPPDPAIDMNSDGKIDFKDYSILADMWLDELLWP